MYSVQKPEFRFLMQLQYNVGSKIQASIYNYEIQYTLGVLFLSEQKGSIFWAAKLNLDAPVMIESLPVVQECVMFCRFIPTLTNLLQ